MNRPRRSAPHALLVLLVSLSACSGSEPPPAGSSDDGRISEFGRYEGYSETRFDEWVTTSEYVEMSDGVRLPST